MIRIADFSDADKVNLIYEKIHDAEEAGLLSIGWERNVYPVKQTAITAIEKKELYVEEDNGVITGAAILNKHQMDSYVDGNWIYTASNDEVFVMHTLVVNPELAGKGTGTRFVKFYEEKAKELGCKVLRIDTQEKNLAARSLYKKNGFREAGIIDCVFNGIAGVHLVLLEKSVC